MEQVWDRLPARPEAQAAPRRQRARKPRTPAERRIVQAGGIQGKVLVTGAAGYLGRHVVAALTRCGADARALVRDSTRVPRDVELDAEVVRGNILDEESIRRSMRGVELVVHCAAVTTNNVPWRLHQQTNVEGTRVVLEEARRAGVRRLLHVSSVVVYGFDPALRNGAVTESAGYPDRVDHWAYYLRSKLDADRMALAMSRESKMEVTVVRPGVLYGPEAARPLDGGIFQLGSVRLTPGRGNNALPLAYVDNVVDGILLALTSPQAAGEAYNLVDEPQIGIRSVSLRAAALAEEPAHLIPLPRALLLGVAGVLESRRERAQAEVPPRLSRFQVRSATRDVRYDVGKARGELGWEPAVPLGEALRRTVARASR
jgi:nucleoside-diphosphate-sugar epimerase